MTTYHAGDYTPPVHWGLYPRNGDPSGPLEVRVTRGGERLWTIGADQAGDLVLDLVKVLHSELD